MEEPELRPRILSPCSSGRRRNGDANSPEFEFWMVRNPSFPQPNLLSADELFSGGVLLPLHHLHLSNDPSPPQDPEVTSGSDKMAHKPEPEPAQLSAASVLTSSKRWRDIFRKTDKKSSPECANVIADDQSTREKDSIKEKKREKKNGGSGAGNGLNAAELNINIWPFSRSRSAGTGGTRPRSSTATRKVSSAPCSRSNSAGDSKSSRKWPSSPGRAGVHLGRSSPVWQVRRSGGGRCSEAAVVKSGEKGVKKESSEGRRKSAVGGGSKARVLSLNVPMCIGYRHHLSCRSDESSPGSVAAGPSGGVSSEGVRGSNFFNIRSLFIKKVY